MAKEEETKPNEKLKTGLVSITGEVGIGIKLPDEDQVISLEGVPVGLAQVLAYLVQTVSRIEKNIA